MSTEEDQIVSSQDSASINRVSVKIPPFWKENPHIWFTQLESQFVNANITSDRTKYHTVVGNIETDILAQVSDIITNPPSQNAYDALKSRLIAVFSDSEERRLKRLLKDLDLGDKRPSVLLREMQDLASNKVGNELLKSLWLQRLPSQMQAILATSDMELSKLALMADKISDVTNPSYAINSQDSCPQKVNFDSINAITPSAENFKGNFETINASLNNLQQQMLEINKKIDKLFKLHLRNRSHSRSNNDESRSPNRNTICWYHSRFGEKSTKCSSPCSYKQEN